MTTKPTTALVFNNVQFDIIDRNGVPWLRSPQIAEALGYRQENRIADLYNRHADEFTPVMTALVKLPTAGGEQEVRIFSPRGCYALGMFARTPVAKAFRQWVLDVLEGKAAPPKMGEVCLDTLTPSEQQTLKEIVQRKVEALPEAARAKAYAEVWSRLQNRFRVAKYSQLPRQQLADAIVYVTGMELRAVSPEPTLTPAQRRELDEAIGRALAGAWDCGGARQWLANRLRVKFNLRDLDEMPASLLPAAIEECRAVERELMNWYAFRAEMRAFVEQQIIGAGAPWTPSLARAWREKMKETLPPRPDWLRLRLELLIPAAATPALAAV